MKAGSYQVKAKGHGSSFMPMMVTIEDDRITKIEVDSSGERAGWRMKSLSGCQPNCDWSNVKC